MPWTEAEDRELFLAILKHTKPTVDWEAVGGILGKSKEAVRQRYQKVLRADAAGASSASPAAEAPKAVRTPKKRKKTVKQDLDDDDEDDDPSPRKKRLGSTFNKDDAEY